MSTGDTPRILGDAARILKTHFEEVFAAYEKRLHNIESPLVCEAMSHKQLRAQAYSIVREVADNLGVQEEPLRIERYRDSLSENIGASRANQAVHVSESLRAATALTEAAMEVVIDNLPTSSSSGRQMATVAMALQESIMERVARASVSYVDYLLIRLRESHEDERRRISRELHDRVAHSIITAFRNLELHEMYEIKDPAKSREKLRLAKIAAQEALQSTRSLSSELRPSSNEEGLEVMLSNYLRLLVPLDVEAYVSVKGDEFLIASEVRDELFLIFREAIRNAIAHSGARKIKVKLATTQDLVKAAVEDDGRGFALERANSTSRYGTGLISIKERASLLGGKLEVASVVGKGTKVDILVPLARNPHE